VRLTPLERTIVIEALKLHRTGIRTFRVPDFAKFCRKDHSKPCLHPSIRNALSHLVKKQVLVRDLKGIYRIDPNLALPSMYRRFVVGSDTPDMVSEYLDSLKKAVEEGRAKFEFHDVNLIAHIDNIYSLFQQAELLPYGWYYDWKYDEKLKMYVGNKKFILAEEQRLSNDRFVKFSITPRDTVEVFIRSSERPFGFSERGMLELHQALVESRVILASFLKAPVRIPDAMEWVVVQWHRNVDSPDEVGGPRVNIKFTDFAEQVGRFYIKEFGTGEVRARAELIEHPGKTIQAMHAELMEANSPFMMARIEKLQQQLEAQNLNLDEVKRTMILLAANLESHIGVIKEMAARRKAESETLDGLTTAVGGLTRAVEQMNGILDVKLSGKKPRRGLMARFLQRFRAKEMNG